MALCAPLPALEPDDSELMVIGKEGLGLQAAAPLGRNLGGAESHSIFEGDLVAMSLRLEPICEDVLCSKVDATSG